MCVSLRKILPLFLPAMLIMAACNSTGCLQNRNSVPLAGFYSVSGQSIIVDSLDVVGLDMPIDTPLYSAGEKLKSVYLPMRSTQPSTTWLFRYRSKGLDFDQLIDTLTFVYDSKPYFASTDCGVIYKYHITSLKCTNHLIERVEITDSVITNFDIEQIKIFFRTQEEEEGGGV